MKVVFAHSLWDERARSYFDSIASSGRAQGINIESFIATPDAPGSRLTWSQLNKKVLTHDRRIRRYRDKLLQATSDADVFWLYNGANFHPAWLSLLPESQLKVYGCFDDPESSGILSAPVAKYFDACLIGNIAAIPLYQGWGCHYVEWIPIFCGTEIPKLRESDFQAEKRPIDLVFFGERKSKWRQERLDYLQKHFPDAFFYGNGWPKGFVSDKERIDIYRKSKIGINVHNSTGPINHRLFELPAQGVLQICDNKCRLNNIFKLDVEVVGYDNIKEACEYIKYYLDPTHESKRLELAWNGHQRFLLDYTQEKIWIRACKKFSEWLTLKRNGMMIQAPKYKQGWLSPAAKHTIKSNIDQFKAAWDFSKSSIKQIVKSDSQNGFQYDDYFQTRIENKTLSPYIHNTEVGACNMPEKLKRIEQGGFFEWPNMVALNWTVAAMIGKAKSIIEVGAGTGCFAYEAAADSTRKILCLEADESARTWAIQNRFRPNISYSAQRMSEIDKMFDVLVAIDVLEHIKDYSIFLKECHNIARKAIITTPNRFRHDPPKLKPDYLQHVQEWSAGEFYWVLKSHWATVRLFGMPNSYIPLCVPTDVNSKLHQLIAVCSDVDIDEVE